MVQAFEWGYTMHFEIPQQVFNMVRTVNGFLALAIVTACATASAAAPSSTAPETIGLTSAKASVAESAGVLRLNVVRSGAPAHAVTVAYHTHGLTAAAGVDYWGETGKLTWADGDHADKIIQVRLDNSTPFSGSKTFLVELVDPTGAELGATSATTVSILGTTQPGTLTMQSPSLTVAENAGAAKLFVMRLGGKDGVAKIRYHTHELTTTPGANYDGTTAELTWADGDAAAKAISIPIKNTTPFVGTKTFMVELDTPEGAALGAPANTLITIKGDGVPSSIALASTSMTVPESTGTVSLRAVRTGSSGGAVSVGYTTVAGTAVAGADFTAETGTLNWADGDTTAKTISVPISAATPYSGTKSFAVQLQGVAGATLGTVATTTVSITGEGVPGRLAFSAAALSVAQTAGVITIKVNRSGGSSGAASVIYATGNGTAHAGTDYTAETGLLTWTVGDASAKTISVPIRSTTSFSGTKTFGIALASATGAGLGSPSSAAVGIVGSAAATLAAAHLSWTAPTLNENGTDLTNLAGYNVYYGTSPTTMTSLATVSDPAAVSYTVGNLAHGTWYFSISAYNSDGQTSGPSTTATATL
jgi:hypothetical protein